MIDFGACLSFGWERLKNNPVFYLVAMVLFGIFCAAISFAAQVIQLVVMLLFAVAAEGAGAGDEAKQLIVLASLPFSLFISIILGSPAAPLLVGFFRGVKREYDGGQAEISEIFSGFSSLIPSFVAYAVSVVIVFLGGICCLVPGLLLSPIIAISMCHIADDGSCGAWEAVARSFATLRKEPTIILWGIVLGVLGAMGALLCAVGLLVTIPLSMAAFYAVYRQVEDGGGKPGATMDTISETTA